MDQTLKRLITKIATFWKKRSAREKIFISGGAVALLALVVLLNVLITAPRYELLFTGMSDADSGAIVSELKSMGVRYKVKGSNIYVDRSKADETRMQLAENGYPQSTLNYSTYASGTSWAMTDSDKRQYAIYQLQDRLQDTIKTIPGIASAEVNIVTGNNDTYVLSSEKIPVTASVKLNLKNGYLLTQKQVQGIVMLVAASVPNLSRDQVTVIDSDGTPLTDSDGGISSTSEEQLKLRNQIENEIRQKVISLLQPVYGKDNVQVAASAVLDFSERTTSSVSYNGDGKPSSQSSSMTVSSPSGTGASGTAGVNSGVPTYPTSSATSSAGTVTESSQQTSYLYDTVTEEVRSKGGELKSLSVAVLLNSGSTAVAMANVSNIQQAVANAVGAPVANISVQAVPFAAGGNSSGAGAPGGLSSFGSLVFGGIAGLLFIMLVITLFIMLHMRRKTRKALALAAEQAVQVPKEPQRPELSIEETIANSAQNTVKKQIEDFADRKPELVAQLLKNWLKD